MKLGDRSSSSHLVVEVEEVEGEVGEELPARGLVPRQVGHQPHQRPQLPRRGLGAAHAAADAETQQRGGGGRLACTGQVVTVGFMRAELGTYDELLGEVGEHVRHLGQVSVQLRGGAVVHHQAGGVAGRPVRRPGARLQAHGVHVPGAGAKWSGGGDIKTADLMGQRGAPMRARGRDWLCGVKEVVHWSCSWPPPGSLYGTTQEAPRPLALLPRPLAPGLVPHRSCSPHAGPSRVTTSHLHMFTLHWSAGH